MRHHGNHIVMHGLIRVVWRRAVLCLLPWIGSTTEVSIFSISDKAPPLCRWKCLLPWLLHLCFDASGYGIKHTVRKQALCFFISDLTWRDGQSTENQHWACGNEADILRPQEILFFLEIGSKFLSCLFCYRTEYKPVSTYTSSLTSRFSVLFLHFSPFFSCSFFFLWVSFYRTLYIWPAHDNNHSL